MKIANERFKIDVELAGFTTLEEKVEFLLGVIAIMEIAVALDFSPAAKKLADKYPSAFVPVGDAK